MKLIVGLGNPGCIYDNTPHNIGFMIIDFFLKYLKKNYLKFDTKLSSLVCECQIEEFQFILAKPQTYMNLSGLAIQKIIKKYKILIEDVLVIHDDIYLKEGCFKLKNKGGHGGHNGIRNIIEILHKDCFKRLKIGIGYNDFLSLDKYVLSYFDKQVKETILNNIFIFFQILEYFIKNISLERILNLLNKLK